MSEPLTGVEAGDRRSDEAWVADLAGDGEARERAVGELRVVLLGGLRRALRNGRGLEDAALEDVVQESVMRILAKLDTYAGRSRFTTWAMSVAVHRAMSELRHRRWKDVSLDRAADDSDFQPERAVDDGLGPDAAAEQKAVLEAMRTIIDRDLTDRQRQALLASIGGMPLEEIARKMNSNRNALYKLTFDARKKLKDGLEQSGFAADDVRSIFAF